MREKILEYVRTHPGCRKRYIASALHIWQCDFNFLATMDDLHEDGLLREEYYKDPAQMEFYSKWYVVEG